MQWENEDVDIGLQVAGRPGSQLTAAIFKIFLEEVMGYDRVRLVPLPDALNMTDYIRALSSEVISEERYIEQPPLATINLDVWAPPGYDVNRVNEAAYDVVYAGALGAEIRTGWFFQRRIARTNSTILDHWRAFQRLEAIRMFSYSETELAHVRRHLTDSEDRHFCELPPCRDGVYTPEWCGGGGGRCAVLLASRPEETGFVMDQISRLKLHVQVFWVGDHLKDLVKHRTEENKPVLFAHYTPSLLTLTFDFVEVAFASCVEGSSCLSGSRYIKKLAWQNLRESANTAEKALRGFHLSQQQYTELLRLRLENPELGYHELACGWLRRHKEIWKDWKPLGNTKILIGGIFPIGGDYYKARGVVPAGSMAVNAVNLNSSVLRDYDLELKLHDGQCSTDKAMKSFIDYIRLPTHKQMAGILGPACSDTVEQIAGVSTHYNTVVISYSAEGALFSKRKQYPFFFRTIGENKQFIFVYKQLLQRLKWKRVASLTEAVSKYSEYISLLHNKLLESGVTFVANRNFPRDTPDMDTYLKDLREKNARIIIADLYEVAARAVMCEAYLKNMTARQGYVWFLPAWFSPDWYIVKKENNTNSTESRIKCSTEDLLQALDGHLALSHAYFANDSDIMQEGITVGEWREKYSLECKKYPVDETDYAGYAYDAVWTYAFALDKLLKEKPSRIQNLHSDETNKRFVELIEKTDFNGVSGNIRFNGPSRISITLVKQWRKGGYHVVGHFTPNISSPERGSLQLNEANITWLTPDGSRPMDGSLAPCDLQPLADLLNTTCDNAMLALNVILLVFIIVILVSCVLFYRRRYEKKVLRLRELGLANETDLRLDEWEIDKENVVINRKLAEGAFGTVYGGEALVRDRHIRAADRRRSYEQTEAWRSVAIKTVKNDCSLEEKLDFLREADVMKHFKHTNIVELLGVCTRSQTILTVMEYMLHGDLKTFLLARRGDVSCKSFKDENNEISSKKLTSMARDVACALSYLAENKYVHRDIACRNCLVNAQHVVKLSDFGMTRSMCENDYYRFNRRGMLPVRWMSPESLTDGMFTPKSDMWSYGVLLFEIITFGSFPFQGLSNSEVLEHVRTGHHVSVPRGVKPELADLLLSCWSTDPERRPDAGHVVELLGIQYPRLISPSLDAPLSVVQLAGQDTHEVDLNAGRKHAPAGPRPAGLFQRATSLDLPEPPEAERLVNGSAGGRPHAGSPVGKYALLDAATDRLVIESTNV